MAATNPGIAPKDVFVHISDVIYVKAAINMMAFYQVQGVILKPRSISVVSDKGVDRGIYYFTKDSGESVEHFILEFDKKISSGLAIEVVPDLIIDFLSDGKVEARKPNVTPPKNVEKSLMVFKTGDIFQV